MILEKYNGFSWLFEKLVEAPVKPYSSRLMLYLVSAEKRISKQILRASCDRSKVRRKVRNGFSWRLQENGCGRRKVYRMTRLSGG